jgi:hypothetical protein
MSTTSIDLQGEGAVFQEVSGGLDRLKVGKKELLVREFPESDGLAMAAAVTTAVMIAGDS